jgi:predicted flap endonuclease-1-like 5' DNA nuclease
MPVKSIIEIDVNDEAFKAFVKSFDKYKEAVKELPEDWDKSSTILADFAESLEHATEEVEKQRDAMSESDKAAERAAAKRKKEQEDARKRQQQQIRESAKAAQDLSKMLIGGALKFAEILGVGGVLGGLLGGGGLFGFDRLADRFGDARKQSMGLGVNPGQLQAAKINFQPYLADAGSTLDKIAEAKMDPVGRSYLTRMGLNPDAPAASLLPQIIERSRKLYDQGVRSPQLLEASGVGRFIDRQEYMTIGAEKKPYLEEALGAYKKESDNGIGDDTYRTFQQFSVSMHRAAQDTENVLGHTLVGLAPDLQDLSKTIVGVIKDLDSSGVLKDLIKDLGDVIKSFAADLKSKEFKDGVKEFIQDIPILAGKIHDALAWFGLIPKGPGDKVGGLTQDQIKKDAETKKNNLDSILGLAQQGGSGIGGAVISAAADAYHVSRQLLDSIWAAESSRGKNKHASSAGAQGDFQFMPATARQYGINPLDPAQAAQGAAHMLADLLKKYHGDAVKATAAYNWGPGNVDKAIRKYHENWLAHAPRETQKYVAKTAGVTIKVNNNTGGQTNVGATMASSLFPVTSGANGL